MIAFLVLSPFLVAPLAAWIASRRPAAAGLSALWPALLTAAFVDAFRSVLQTGPYTVVLPWAPSLGLSFSFHLDGLGLLFALLITAIGTLVVLYASSYLHGRERTGRFYASLFFFMGAMLGVALSDNLLTLFVFWELTGFTSFLLIGFEHDRADARYAALQALIVTGCGGLALLAGALLIGQVAGTFSLVELRASAGLLQAHALYPAIAALVLLAAFTKSAQVPFHFWLPGAMAAPTPVSAYLHSATMVKAGVYLVARLTPVLGGTAGWEIAVTTIGGLTMVAAAWRSVQETDLKRILAYSTVSALGVLTMLLGRGTPEAVTAAVVYLVAHACYKGGLFLVSGAIDHETGTRNVAVLGGLSQAMPYTALAGALAAVSMAGLPLTLGFVAKEALYSAPFEAGVSTVVIAASVIASALLGLAGLVAGFSPFAGTNMPTRAAHEASPLLWGPPLLLGLIGLVTGIVPWLLDAPLDAAATSVLGSSPGVHLAIWHGVTPALLLSVVTLAAIAALYVARGRVRESLWPRSLRSDRLYAGTVRALDAVSRVIAPPLHSASLRSYVLAVVLVTGTCVGTALALVGVTRTPRLATIPQAHEILVVLLIVIGALSAAVAQSSMAAVLSLGTVGYGVALMFLFFGAPDLAMTQFSVETLTVVIFVLVFRYFPRFGALSPALIRARDALVAGGFGLIIAALVLFVGTSGVPSRLAGYFMTMAPTEGHGRNVVNVILVDFRAFDTLGEITVLVTAAIGVHALLRLAVPDAPRRDTEERRS
ncbi:MAG TPA: hydrogen gas-evolving membrane-bound hydrogenase subunit E [Vicinamibacterales bacterium]